jgi:hypothetical protein
MAVFTNHHVLSLRVHDRRYFEALPTHSGILWVLPAKTSPCPNVLSSPRPAWRTESWKREDRVEEVWVFEWLLGAEILLAGTAVYH